ncbi:hypothetical protein ACROYT_G011195 [Oculina patagonica]
MAFKEIQFKHKIALIVSILCMSLGIIFPLCHGCFDDECRNIEFKEPVANRAMKNHVIRSEEVPNEGTCRLLCYMEPNCVSINLGPFEGGKHKCELNNATDENQITMILVDKPSFTYLAIELTRIALTSTNLVKGKTVCTQSNLTICLPLMCFVTKQQPVGGWTVFQKRQDGSVDFYLYWSDYKQGFGNLSGEFWLGNDKIHRLTSGGNERLRVDLEDFEGNTRYANYSTFSVMGENEKYRLILGAYSDDECRNIEFKEPVADRAMKNHVIRSEEVPNEGTCRLLCYMEPNCVSINLGPLEGGKHKCELNNATDENQITMILVDKPSFTYLAIEVTLYILIIQKSYKNCADIYKSGERRDGVYTIKPDNLHSFNVFCDQTTAGGGWTVFQKRQDGSENFYLYWNDYKQGFGNLSGEFWLGNDKIHRLTSGGNKRLRVDLEDFEGNITYAEYSTFSVMGENEKYRLILGAYSGTAGDSLASHNGQMFSTQDQDNDSLDFTHCAIRYKGAWWFKACRNSNLNGIYLQEADPSLLGIGVKWKHWRGDYYSLKRTEMKIRPVDF